MTRSDSQKAFEKEVRDRLLQLSDRISTQVRTLGLGIIAFGWTLFTSTSLPIQEFVQRHRLGLLKICTIAILALLLDFGQYVAGYVDSTNVRKKLESTDGRLDIGYDPKTNAYRIQSGLFLAKQVVIATSALSLLYLIVRFAWRGI